MEGPQSRCYTDSLADRLNNRVLTAKFRVVATRSGKFIGIRVAKKMIAKSTLPLGAGLLYGEGDKAVAG